MVGLVDAARLQRHQVLCVAIPRQGTKEGIGQDAAGAQGTTRRLHLGLRGREVEDKVLRLKRCAQLVL
jgi:hypothetical protein